MSAKFTLQDYEQPFQTLFEHSTNAVFLIGADCRYAVANPAGLRLLGYTQNELQQLRFSDQLIGYEPSTDAPATSVMPGQTQTERWEHQRKDGSHFLAQIHSCALSDTAFLTTIHDLSGQTPAASAVPPEQDAMLRLQAAVRASQVGLWDWDLNTNQVYYSAEWKRQIGYGEQEISNDFSEWQLRVHPDDLARMQHAVQAYLKEPDRGFQQEFRFRHKDGSYRWIYTQASLIYDATGQASHMLGSHIDITDHQQLAAQQYAADRQRAVLLESISDAFLALDGDWCFTYVNSKAGELINRRPEALLGKHIWTEIPEAVGQEFYYVYQKAMTERVPVKREAFFPPWDRWFESRMYPAQDGGLSVYFTDVTTRKQAETLLAGQKYVLELMAANTPLPEILDALLQVIEAQAPNLQASILLLDDDGVHMRHCAAPSLPQSYTEALDGLAIGSQVGSCGTAMFRREAVIVEDIATDPLWEDYRELALAHGLQACWSTPLLDMADKVLGSFAFYYSQPGRPTERHQQLINSTAHLATIAIRRYQEEAALRASEARYVDLYEQAPDMHCSVDANTGLILHCNQRLLDVTGYTRDEVIGQLVWSLCHTSSQDEMHRLWQQFGDSGEIRDAELRIQCKDGHCRDISLNATAVRDAQGKVLHSRSVWRDVTERKQAEHKIRRLNRMYAMLSGINALIVRVREQQELFDDACNMAVETGGFGMAWVDKVGLDGQVAPVATAGKDATQLLALRSAPDYPKPWAPIGRALHTRRVALVNDLEAELQRGLANERRQLAYRLGYRAVISLPLFMEGALVGLFTLSAKEANVFTEEEVKLLTEMAGDISFALDYLAKVQQLDYLAYYDVLTGLPNRTLFRDHIDREVRRTQRDQTQVAIVLCDINRFRHINETLGRQAGDALLCELATRFRQHWPEADNIGRIAADCFGGIITGLKSAADIVHRIETPLHELLHSPIKIEGKLLRLSLTLGIALAPSDGSESEVLLKNAEIALKEAKSRGEHRLLYRPQMNAAVSATLALEIKLRQALEQQQFVLHYQPKINLMTGTVSGLEALLRWHDPEQGLIPPGRFIPLLEETGMILDVGGWAIRQALADYHQWYIQGLQPPRIAVNISAVQLRREDFVDSIADSIKTTRAGPHGLDLELTESQLIEHIDTTVGKLQQLRAMGIKIAIDDFGTGFSSLGYLARLPVDALKIDRSFTMTMVDDANSMSIVAAIISLAHALGLKVIAEGVETPDQKRYLKVLKCDEFQGYLNSPPVPFEQITQLLQGHRPE